MQERDRTHRPGSGDEDLTRIFLMMMMDMKILMARMMWTIDYEVCASGTGRNVEDDNNECDDDHYDDGDGDGDDGDDGDVGVNERDNVDNDEMCKSKRGPTALAKMISMRTIMMFSMMLKKMRIILRQRSIRLRMIMIILVWIISPKAVRTR